MKSRSTAAFLSIFFGAFGAHKFYLGESGKGFFRAGLMVFSMMSPGLRILPMILGVIGIVEGIVLLSMSEREFDRRYNKELSYKDWKEVRRNQPRQADRRRPQRPDKQAERSGTYVPREVAENRKKGIKKFKDFDIKGAIKDFEKALKKKPNDVALHFNLACCYSLEEKTDKALLHLAKAVEYGFTDFDKIESHDSLAFLRIQPEFEEFVQNNHRLPHKPKESVKKIEAPELGKMDLLEQLTKLADLRKKGIISDAEFADQKRRLLG